MLEQNQVAQDMQPVQVVQPTATNATNATEENGDARAIDAYWSPLLCLHGMVSAQKVINPVTPPPHAHCARGGGFLFTHPRSFSAFASYHQPWYAKYRGTDNPCPIQKQIKKERRVS